eukprot:SM000023S07677  [mRNA]  locus=s23:881348:882024:+ [translate_table: standard]
MKVAPSTGAVAALLVLLLARLTPSEAAAAVPPAAEDPSNDFVIFSEDQAWSYGQLALGNKALEADLPQLKQLQQAPAREEEKQNDVQAHSAGLRGGHHRRISISQNPTVYEVTDGDIQVWYFPLLGKLYKSSPVVPWHLNCTRLSCIQGSDG